MKYPSLDLNTFMNDLRVFPLDSPNPPFELYHTVLNTHRHDTDMVIFRLKSSKYLYFPANSPCFYDMLVIRSPVHVYINGERIHDINPDSIIPLVALFASDILVMAIDESDPIHPLESIDPVECIVGVLQNHKRIPIRYSENCIIQPGLSVHKGRLRK